MGCASMHFHRRVNAHGPCDPQSTCHAPLSSPSRTVRCTSFLCRVVAIHREMYTTYC